MSGERMWTPYDIKLLLHLHTTPEPWPLSHTEHYSRTMGKFHSMGLVDNPDFPRVTDKGIALVEMWCLQPLPIAVWSDPRALQEKSKEAQE